MADFKPEAVMNWECAHLTGGISACAITEKVCNLKVIAHLISHRTRNTVFIGVIGTSNTTVFTQIFML